MFFFDIVKATLPNLLSEFKKCASNDSKKFSIGFSDDDLGNVRAVEEFVQNELNKMYPEIHFVVYDTSENGKRKMVIEKE